MVENVVGLREVLLEVAQVVSLEAELGVLLVGLPLVVGALLEAQHQEAILNDAERRQVRYVSTVILNG